jgi:septal ring factor EnvC (AmiA/AmiB activator)
MLPSGVEVDMNGVDIATSPGQQVRSVFDGTVLDIQELPLRGYHVVVGHGAYFTVYSNLKEILVKKGQEVSRLTPIGIAKTDKTSQETKVHFQIYQQFTVMDPEAWLAKKD